MVTHSNYLFYSQDKWEYGLIVQDEMQLLARARALDPEALSQVHNEYYRPIFRYVSFRVGDHKAAEDLTSEVFTRLLSALRDKTAPQNTLRGWLYGVAARVVSDHYRRQARAREILATPAPALTRT